MRPLHFILPSGAVWTLTLQHVLLVCAVALAMGIFSEYVQLLQDSVARGTRLRADQQGSAERNRVKATAIPLAYSPASAPARAREYAREYAPAYASPYAPTRTAARDVDAIAH